MSEEPDKRTWADGVRDSIKIVKYRRDHYGLYVDTMKNEAMRTAAGVVAVLDETLIFLEAMLLRGEYASRLPVDG